MAIDSNNSNCEYKYRRIYRERIPDNIPPYIPPYLVNKKDDNNKVQTNAKTTPPPSYTKDPSYSYYPQITNYVVTLTLNVHVDVGRVTLYLSNTERKPRKFAAVVIRIDRSINGTTCLLFKNGKMVITGAKTYAAALLAAHLYRLCIETVPQPVIVRYDRGEGGKNMGPGGSGSVLIKRSLELSTLARITQFKNFRVQNIVGSGKIINEAINLALLDRDVPDTVWEPELFPGLKHFVALPGGRQCTALIFDTGKVVITGAKDKIDVYYAYNYCRNLVSSYVDKNAPTQNGQRFAYRVNSMMNQAYKSRQHRGPGQQQQQQHSSHLNDDNDGNDISKIPSSSTTRKRRKRKQSKQYQKQLELAVTGHNVSVSQIFLDPTVKPPKKRLKKNNLIANYMIDNDANDNTNNVVKINDDNNSSNSTLNNNNSVHQPQQQNQWLNTLTNNISEETLMNFMSDL